KIEGLTARQVSRIEKGECRATSTALAKLAKAHVMETNQYMKKIAEISGRKTSPAPTPVKRSYTMANVFEKSVERVISTIKAFEILYTNPNHVWFIPKELVETFKKHDKHDGWDFGLDYKPCIACPFLKFESFM